MNQVTISGIQQIGIGVPNVAEAWKWYRKYLGMDIKVFEESATAALMLPYTGGVPQKRHAVLALNLSGGGGFEIWQYTERVPQPPKFVPALGDLGIFAAKIKARNVQKTHEYFTSEKLKVSPVVNDPEGRAHFFLTDPYNNIFQIIESQNWFADENKNTGSAYGVIIGVSDIKKSAKVYSDILGYDKVTSDTKGKFSDFSSLNGGDASFRRVILKNSKPRLGAFAKLFGDSEIELLQVEGRVPRKIFEGRFWGDLGFIHLCFDIQGMNALKEECARLGSPFTVDSSSSLGNSFDMGEAAGHFSYIEDPDGTLIEFVETHKVPILKKFGWYLNLRKRDPEKFLPNWVVKALGMNRVKD